MNKFRIRCDYCGVEHRVETDGTEIKVENYSAMVYPVVEDIQSLNDLEAPEEKPEDDNG